MAKSDEKFSGLEREVKGLWVDYQLRTKMRGIFDAKVEQLWKLGMARERPKIRFGACIEAVSDIECEIAKEASVAISMKYDIKKHDYAMLLRANDLSLFHALARNFEQRIRFSEEHAEEFLKNIDWQ